MNGFRIPGRVLSGACKRVWTSTYDVEPRTQKWAKQFLFLCQPKRLAHLLRFFAHSLHLATRNGRPRGPRDPSCNASYERRSGGVTEKLLK